MFVAFEGIDGSGKSTIIEHIKFYSKLNLITREPGGTYLGDTLRTLLLKKPVSPMAELLLFQAARIENYRINIEPFRQRRIVITDRYYGSTLAYQTTRGNLDFDLVESIVLDTLPEDATPDITILIDCDVDIALKRRGKRPSDRIEKNTNLTKIREKYLELANKYNWIIIDNSTSDLESTIKQVKQVIYGH